MSIVIKDANIIQGEGEHIIYISYDDIISYVDIFYCINMTWEDSIIFILKKNKIKITKNKGKYNEFFFQKEDVFIRISENHFDYMISQLMYYYHFKEAQANHIHIECHDKNRNSYDLTLFFEDSHEPMSAEEMEKRLRQFK